jgi:hypothetical protein
MPLPLEYIQIRAPSFALNPNISALIAHAELETGCGYGSEDLRNKAVALLVCHWLALQARDAGDTGVTGNIVSEKEGDLSRSFSDVSLSTNNSYLSQTSWGMELIQLQNSRIMLPYTRAIICH